MRKTFTVLHRCAGLMTAAFLFFSGMTGAVISWEPELDHLLNRRFFEVKSEGKAKPSIELAQLVEQRDPRVRVAYIPITPKLGESLTFLVQRRVDPATGKRYVLDYNQIYVDPNTGAEVGRRLWGAVWPVTRETFASFLYKLHYTLHIPEFWGSDRWGNRFLGVIAGIWAIDCLVGFYLTLPSRRKNNELRSAVVTRQLERGFWRRWKPAWKIRTSRSSYRLNFDLHRAFGLWTWVLLFVIAFTAFSLNLYFEVFSPLMKKVSSYTPTPYELRRPAPPDAPIEPKFSFVEIIAKAEADGRRRGWTEPVGAISYAQQYGIYGARFFKPDAEENLSGLGPPQLFYDGQDGRLLGAWQPWVGTAADIFAQAQFPAHSGRILGLPGRILISLMGLVVAALSVTGVVIWYRKRRARLHARSSELTRQAVFIAAK
jgi:uncharacterized iron-regulated membrane protein